jgi:hypothetical protein
MSFYRRDYIKLRAVVFWDPAAYKKRFVSVFALKCWLVYLYAKWWSRMNVYFLLDVNDIHRIKIIRTHSNSLEIMKIIHQSIRTREFLLTSFNWISILHIFRDNWGRKWCHLVAMDAIYFRNASTQYDIKCADRELVKAYTSFRPLKEEPDYKFGIATGNWGCGAFNGDRQVKGIYSLIITKFSLLTSLFSDHSIDGCFRSWSTTYLCSLSR